MIKPDRIIRSKRKTIALVVTPDAQLIVRAPNETSMEYIDWLIEKKKLWIKQKIAHVKKLNETHQKKQYLDGEGFLYLGKWLRLRIKKEQEQPLVYDGEYLFIVESNLPNADYLITNWYKEMSRRVLTERVDWFVKCYGFNYTRITITDAQKRWGSCGHNNTLNFSWRLVIAPMEVIDYVVIHELCHTTEKNHSDNFWVKVKTILPNYKNSIKWLEQNQRVMDI
jgi:predicted metal-dependent hydrolase